MKILMLCSTFPYPPNRGGTQNRTFNLLKSITGHHQVTLITQQVNDLTDNQIKELKDYVTELVIFPSPQPVSLQPLAKITRLINAFREGIPPNVKYLYSQSIQDWVDDAIGKKEFEVITCEHSVNEIYIRPEWYKQLKTVINIHSSIYKTCKNQLETNTSQHPLRDRFYLPLLRRYEQKTLAKFSQIVVTTPEDAEQMRQFNPNAAITVIPNGVDLTLFPYRQRDPGGYQLIFVGGLDYFVNIDAVCYFSREIFPLLQQKYPQTTLTLVGANPSPEVKALTKQSEIIVTGRVPSVVEYLHQATVAIAPLRTGFGMKIKTLEYMASGVPVVGSDRGLEGISVDDPTRALRANTPAEYVVAIGKLFQNAELRSTISSNARKMIETEYTWQQAGTKYESVLTH
jgi:glycosyltransferase involved in cell wall biosynthesis